MATQERKRSHRNGSTVFAASALLLAVAVLASLLAGCGTDSRRLDEMQSEVSRLSARIDSIKVSMRVADLIEKVDKQWSMVDLSEPSVQPIGNGFHVVQLEVAEHLTGVKVSGRVINTQSVVHETVVFTLSMSGDSKEFTIGRISPGNSTAFSVYMPDVSPENARFAHVGYVRSMVMYYQG